MGQSAATQSSGSEAQTQAAVAPPAVVTPAQPPSPGITGDWWGYRSKWANDGLTVAAAIYYDFSKNLQGGVSTSQYASRELLDVDFTWTTDQLLNWHGGTFFFNFLNHEGTNGSTLLTGDAQMFDNQDGPGDTQIAQLFFQQMLADDQLRLKIGRMDSASDFAYTTNGSDFLGASFGTSPALLDFPTYPDPALGAALFWTPNSHFYLSGDVSDSNKSDRFGVLSGDPYNIDAAGGGGIVIAETGAQWSLGAQQLAGRLGVGGYRNTGTLERFDGGTQDGANGMYAVFDQTVWQEAAPASAGATPSNIGIFGQYGLGDGHVSPFEQHIGGGFQWTGPIPSQARAADVLGVGASYVDFGSSAAFTEPYELELEGFYKVQLTPWFNVQPDVQYIIHPGGTGIPNACVVTVRVELDF
jgi:porin